MTRGRVHTARANKGPPKLPLKGQAPTGFSCLAEAAKAFLYPYFVTCRPKGRTGPLPQRVVIAAPAPAERGRLRTYAEEPAQAARSLSPRRGQPSATFSSVQGLHSPPAGGGLRRWCRVAVRRPHPEQI